MPDELSWLFEDVRSDGDAAEVAALAERLQAAGDLHTAATAWDRAFARDPQNPQIRHARAQLLDHLALIRDGVAFRYIPAGTFLMGCDASDADADEQPVHPVRLDHFWISDTPISWAAYCRLMDWNPPPDGMPRQVDATQRDQTLFLLHLANRIRLQYCEDQTQHARDWHAHLPEQFWKKGTGELISSRKLFGEPPRGDAALPWGYDAKAMVCVGSAYAEKLCARTGLVLPTEAQWEKAARGGLAGRRYPWGDEPPIPDRCDFNRFDEFSIRPMKKFPSNDYGLYAASGGVWEWTSDWYDAQYYAHSPATNPTGPAEGKQRVVRGGSWSDCAQACTVSFRMSMAVGDDRAAPHAMNPNLGFRVVLPSAD